MIFNLLMGMEIHNVGFWFMTLSFGQGVTSTSGEYRASILYTFQTTWCHISEGLYAIYIISNMM